MPNWCLNQLTITGSLRTLSKFRKENSDKEDGEYVPIRFEKAVVPDRPEGMGTIDIDANVGAWGTKWDLDAGTFEERQGNGYFYAFHTAWGPPLEWLSVVASMYPSITFELHYMEPGMGFAGRQFYQRGDLKENEEVDTSDKETCLAYCKRFDYFNDCEECECTGETEGMGQRAVACNQCNGTGQIPGFGEYQD